METWATRLPRALAFFQRAFGLHTRHQPFERVSQRSRSALKRLEAPQESLRFQVALAQLRYDWDLLEEDAANDDDALRLQVHLLELAPDVPQARAFIMPRLDEAPISRLFGAILLQAMAESAEAIRFDFTGRSIKVFFRDENREWSAMSIPANLEGSLMGLLRFVEAAGFRRIRWHLRGAEGMPGDVGFRWPEASGLVLTLG